MIPYRWLGLLAFTVGLGEARAEDRVRQRSASTQSRLQADDLPSDPKALGAGERSTPQSAKATESKWYGEQVLLMDGVTVVLVAAGATGGGPFLAAGLVTYLFAPAAVHMTHDRGGAAVLSPLMRVGLPFLCILAVAETGSSGGNGSYDDGWIAAPLLAGVAGAVAIDAAVMSYEEVAVTEDERAGAFGAVVAWHPSLALTPEGARVVVSGAF